LIRRSAHEPQINPREEVQMQKTAVSWLIFLLFGTVWLTPGLGGPPDKEEADGRGPQAASEADSHPEQPDRSRGAYRSEPRFVVSVVGGKAASTDDADAGGQDAAATAAPGSGEKPEKSHHRVYEQQQSYPVYGIEDHDAAGRDGSMMVTIPRNLVEDPREPSAEALRAQGFVFVDRETGDSFRRVSPCRYEITYTDDSGKVRRLPDETECLIKPELSASVEQQDDGTLRYTYTLRNGEDAEQPVMTFHITLPRTDILLSKVDRAGWRPYTSSGVPLDLYGETYFGWGPRHVPMLAPGEEVGGLSVTSRYLPGLTEFDSKGFAPQATTEPLPYDLNEAIQDVGGKEHGVGGLTVGPMIEPPGSDPTARAAVIDRLNSDVERALGGDLIDGAGADKLRAVLARARANVGTRATLGALATEISSIEGIDPSYQKGVEVAIRALAEF
jgi:hypothetical protein